MKKVLSALVLALLVTSVVGCSSGGSPTKTTPTNPAK